MSTIDTARFKPNTVYVTYIAATPDKVWRALTSPEFTKAYFFGQAIEVEPRAGGTFVMRLSGVTPGGSASGSRRHRHLETYKFLVINAVPIEEIQVAPSTRSG